MSKRNWTDATVANLKPKVKVYTIADPGLPGHYLRVHASGVKTYYAVARDPRGKQIWHAVGSPNVFTLDDAQVLPAPP